MTFFFRNAEKPFFPLSSLRLCDGRRMGSETRPKASRAFDEIEDGFGGEAGKPAEGRVRRGLVIPNPFDSKTRSGQALSRSLLRRLGEGAGTGEESRINLVDQ